MRRAQRLVRQRGIRQLHAPLPSRACGDDDFHRLHLRGRATTRRSPRKREFALVETEIRPFPGQVIVLAQMPPDIRAAGRGHLEFEVIGRPLAAQQEPDFKGIRKPERDDPAHDDEAATAVEIIIQPHAGLAARCRDGRKHPLCLTGGEDLPCAGIGEQGEERVRVHAARQKCHLHGRPTSSGQRCFWQ